MRPSSFSTCSIALLSFAFFAKSADVRAQGEQSQAVALPDNWTSLPPQEFLSQVKALDASGQWPAGQRKLAIEHAGVLLKSMDVKGSSTKDLPSMEGLQVLCWKTLPGDDQTRIRNDLLSRSDDWAGTPYEEIRAKVMMLIRVKEPLSAFGEARAWVAAGGTLEEAKKSPLALEDLKHPLANAALEVLFKGGEPIYGGVTIDWEGFLVAPQSGEYTLSVSPLNVNADVPGYQLVHSTTVALDGTEIIHAAHDRWSPRSERLQLVAGNRTDIKVHFQMKSDPSREHIGVLNVILFWEGPGVGRSVIPSSALLAPDGHARGLSATYSWTDTKGQSKTISQVDPVIDFIWPKNGLGVIGDHIGEGPELLLLAKSKWRESVSPRVLDQLEANGRVHPLIQSADDVAFSLSTKQRDEFLDLLLGRPELLRTVSPGIFWKFYRVFHIGSPEKSLEVLGLWGRQHADSFSAVTGIASQFSSNQELRFASRELGQSMFQESPEMGEELRRRSLEQENGQCSLPIAYILAYGYQSTGRLANWIQLLDERLSDAVLVGDKRVNWLLARAMAEDLKGSASLPYYQTTENVSYGIRWVKEASTAAESPDAQARCSLELASRYSGIGDNSKALDLLVDAPAPADSVLIKEIAGAKDRLSSISE